MPDIVVDVGDASSPLEGLYTKLQALFGAATSTALAGTSSGAGLVGPFAPQLGRPINVLIDGLADGAGQVQLRRSKDNNSANAKPLTRGGATIGVFVNDAHEVSFITECETGATYWLSLPVAGITYRLSQ